MRGWLPTSTNCEKFSNMDTDLDEYTHILIAEIQELVELYSTERECAEGSLLLDLGGESGVGDGGISLDKSSNFQHFFLRNVSAGVRTMVIWLALGLQRTMKRRRAPGSKPRVAGGKLYSYYHVRYRGHHFDSDFRFVDTHLTIG